MHIYGLTGGIACGKSEAAKRFVERGIPVIDADEVAHELLEPGGAAVDEVTEAFGEYILTGGQIDRTKLGDHVFRDPVARRTINAITHPLVVRVIVERCAGLAQEGHQVVVIDAALLAENGRREPWLDGLILVSCGEDLRGRRLVEKRGMTPGRARDRIEAQTPPDSKVPLADWVIENESTVESLHAGVDRIVDEILAIGNG